MPNQLSKAKSPYLRQHEDNPVYWHEWGDEALSLAKKENKLILVSIGYSACHWCHVMAHESFEDQETAEIMNTHFINIKIDREERPDLDAIYMDACQLVTGRGGWPLNAFALPNGSPFHAGTYFPKSQWQKTLLQIAQLWEQEPHKVLNFAHDLKAGIEKMSGFIPDIEESQTTSSDALASLSPKFDLTHGGMIGAPKFPMPTLWNCLIDTLLQNKQVQEHTLFTLNQMRLGGIYDWVESGFARYAVDDKWFAPHFEKMLYDNAQLISLFTRAYAITENVTFLSIAENCAQFTLNEWKAEDGGFFSAYDADSEGTEGKYYCYTYEEINALPLKQKGLFNQFFQISEKGNWENGLNILYPLLDEQEFALQNSIAGFDDLLKHWKGVLKQSRLQRIKPGLDNKQNTSWNAMLLSSFSHLYQVSLSKKWEEEARLLLSFLLKVPSNSEGELLHMVHQKKPYIKAFFEDYAQLIHALLNYFETFSDQKILERAINYSQVAIALFFDEESGFFKSSRDHTIISRKIEVTDNVIPSSNSLMCENLLKLGLITGKEAWFEKGEQMLRLMQNKAHKHPEFYANWCRLLVISERGYPYLVTNSNISPGSRNKVWMNLFWKLELADFEIFKGKDFNKSKTYYYCANKVCQAPVYSTKHIRYF